ncbi:MAG: hypothetical protein R2688_08520 [Fimbriimonadaceae bacterium]
MSSLDQSTTKNLPLPRVTPDFDLLRRFGSHSEGCWRRNGIDLPIVAYNEVSAQANVEFVGQITNSQPNPVETSIPGEGSVA